jgi:hypothetical protein
MTVLGIVRCTLLDSFEGSESRHNVDVQAPMPARKSVGNLANPKTQHGKPNPAVVER